jgi:hypothetical protein
MRSFFPITQTSCDVANFFAAGPVKKIIHTVIPLANDFCHHGLKG